MNALLTAAKLVITRWEHGDLADAVRLLDEAVNEEEAVMKFPFQHDDVIQHVSREGDRFVVRLVDESVFEAYVENLDDGGGTRVINPDNWTKIGVLHNGEIR